MLGFGRADCWQKVDFPARSLTRSAAHDSQNPEQVSCPWRPARQHCIVPVPAYNVAMRACFFVLAAGCAAIGICQDVPWQPQGSITSREYRNERRTGSGVVGTEFYSLVYSVSLRVIPTDTVREDEENTMECRVECQGKKHAKHDECDTSCDKPCRKKHELKMRGTYKPLIPNMRQARKDSARLAMAAGGTPGGDDWTSASSSALRDIQRDAEKLHTITMAHSTKPCGTVKRWFGRRKHEVEVRGQFRKVGYYMTGGQRTPIDEPAGEHTKVVAETWIPDNEPLTESEGWVCHCFKPKETPQDQPRTGKPPLMDPRTPTYSGLGYRRPDGTLVIPEKDKVSVKTTGDGINYVNTAITNNTGEDLVVSMMPGTIAVPKDDSYQIMVMMADAELLIPASSTALLALRGPTVMTGEGVLKARAACTEITKRQPTERTEFTLQPSNDDHLAAICQKTNKSRIRLGKEQARVWIYKDKATIDEINKVLVPGVTPGMYLDALRDVENVGSVDVATNEFKRCFEPKLLLGVTASAEATDWFVDRMAQTNPKALATFLEKSKAELATMLMLGKDKIEVQHVADLFRALFECEAESIRTVGLKLFDSLASPERKVELAALGALDTLYWSLGSKDSEELVAAAKVAGSAKHQDSVPQLTYLSEYGPSDAVKSAAAAALAAVGKPGIG